MRRLWRGSLCSAWLVVVSACGPLGEGWVGVDLTESRFAVQVAIDPSGLSFLDARPLERPSLGGRQPGRQLAWVLEGYAGGRLAEGTLADPRRARAEWLEGAALHSATVNAGVGVLELELPGTPGMLIVYEQDGATRYEIGRLAYAPEQAGGRLAQPLAAKDDLLGPAFQIAGRADPTAAVDMLFLPDGYLEEELEGFYADALAVFNQILEQPDFAAHAGAFNAWAQPLRSRDSGIDIPSEEVFRDTALDNSFEVYVDRCVYPKTSEAIALIEKLADKVSADVVIVIVNSERYGGCAGQRFTTQTRHPYAALVGAHELGHTLLLLDDEYEDGTCQPEAVGPNISASWALSALPWADLVTTTTLPTPEEESYDGVVGAFEGAAYCTAGMYRPQQNCLMRDINAPMCAVCRRELDRFMAKLAPPPSTDEDGAGAEDAPADDDPWAGP